MMTDFTYSPVVTLSESNKGAFSAFIARQNAYSGLMSPVIGFDHFTLTEDIFGPHKHVAMSAISYVFEDSVSVHNKDSIGTDLMISPGSLLWTWAGKGVVHHEVPAVKGGTVHGLQLFLDTPPETRALDPKSIYIPAEDVPVQLHDGVSLKVVMGKSGDLVNKATTPEPVTLLDVSIDAGKSFKHPFVNGLSGTVYVMSGSLTIGGTFSPQVLNKNDTIAFHSNTDTDVIFSSSAGSRFLFVSGPPVINK